MQPSCRSRYRGVRVALRMQEAEGVNQEDERREKKVRLQPGITSYLKVQRSSGTEGLEPLGGC